MLYVLSSVSKILLFIAFFGSVTAAISFALAVAGGIKFRKQATSHPSFRPPVSVLKPLHGAESEQAENLRSFFALEYPSFELIFCARTLTDPAILCAKELAKEFPSVPARFIASGEPLWTNPKIFSMSLLTREAANEIVLFSDSDIRVKPDYLKQIIQPLKDPKVGMVTCAFRGKPVENFSSLLIALNQTVEFSSGVVTANMLEGMKFALGPTLLTRKEVIRQIGGFEPMQDMYADDFCLGNRIANSGYTVILPSLVVDHIIHYRTLAAGLKHQIVWMKSTRRSRPLGHFGVGLTYAMPFGLLGLVVGLATGHFAIGLLLLFAACANRWLQALIIGHLIMQDRNALKFFWLYPVCDLLGFWCWFASNFGTVFDYRGEKYRFLDGGRIARLDRKSLTVSP